MIWRRRKIASRVFKRICKRLKNVLIQSWAKSKGVSRPTVSPSLKCIFIESWKDGHLTFARVPLGMGSPLCLENPNSLWTEIIMRELCAEAESCSTKSRDKTPGLKSLPHEQFTLFILFCFHVCKIGVMKVFQQTCRED